MPRPGPSVTSGADLQPGSDSLFPSGFTGGGARPSAGSVGTSEIADGSVSGADLNLASVTAALNNTYAPRFPSRGFRALRNALDMGQTTAISWQGDSTGDSNGSAADGNGERLPYRWAQKIAARYPNFHVLSKQWDDATQDYGTWVTVQSQAAGRRYFSGNGLRSARYVAPTAAFSTGNMDLRVLVAPNAWAPGSGGDRTLIVRYRPLDLSGYVQQFRWIIDQTGLMKLRWSSDGTSWGSDRVASTAVTGTDGVAQWLRVTLTIANPGASGTWTVKYYTSPANDGVTWTQLGTTLTFTGTVPAMYDATQNARPPFFEIGASEWQPSGAALPGKVYEVQVRDGVGGKCITPCCPEQWQPYPENNSTYGGAPTLYLLNGSRSGSAMTYHADSTRLPLMTQDYGQTVHAFNDSHNEIGATGPNDWLTPYQAWVTAVLARLPRATPLAIGQNPHTSAWVNETSYGYHHKIRLRELAALASAQNWGHADLYSAIANDPRGAPALISADGLHPNSNGYEVGALTLMAGLGFTS